MIEARSDMHHDPNTIYPQTTPHHDLPITDIFPWYGPISPPPLDLSKQVSQYLLRKDVDDIVRPIELINAFNHMEMMRGSGSCWNFCPSLGVDVHFLTFPHWSITIIIGTLLQTQVGIVQRTRVMGLVIRDQYGSSLWRGINDPIVDPILCSPSLLNVFHSLSYQLIHLNNEMGSDRWSDIYSKRC